MTAKRPTTGRARLAGWIGALAVMASLPYAQFEVPYLADGAINSAGNLSTLALCCVFGAVTVSYDIQFGWAGLFSLGHALPFTLGAYGTAIIMGELRWPLWAAATGAVGVVLVVSAAVGAVSLRTAHITFAVVTLASAQVGSLLVTRNIGDLTGGEEGLAVPVDGLPDALVGLRNTRNLYWLALAALAVTVGVAKLSLASRAGHWWQAVRDNPLRAAVLGVSPRPHLLTAFLASSTLAGLGGVVYVVVAGGVTPAVTTPVSTLTLLVMAVLGGSRSIAGAMAGGMAYWFVDARLTRLGTSGQLDDLPDPLAVPLSEPLFLLGLSFVALVVFAPGGLAEVARRLRART
jgi:branched-chain amino acid transport system permease protein